MKKLNKRIRTGPSGALKFLEWKKFQASSTKLREHQAASIKPQAASLKLQA